MAFDLAKFAPNPVAEFTLRGGRTYKVIADPEVDQVARMLRVEAVINGHDDGDTGEALVEAKQILAELIAEADPGQDVADFKITSQQMMAVFHMILRGQSVAEAVLEAIGGGDPDLVVAAEPGEAGASEGGRVGDAAPLASEKSSSRSSSGSAETDAGLRATGTG